MKTHQLKVDSAMFSYQNQKVLRGAYLNCKSGDVIGVLGRNGCGKSTLLQMIFGSLKGGSICTHIDETYIEKPYKSRQIAYLPQQPFLPTESRLKHIVKLFISKKERQLKILKHPRIYPLRNHKIKQLSGGEQRFLEVLLILSLPAPFILLDEPYASVEPLYIEAINQELKQHSNKGIILTDHDYRNIIKVSKRLVFIKEGRIFPINDKSELKGGYLPY